MTGEQINRGVGWLTRTERIAQASIRQAVVGKHGDIICSVGWLMLNIVYQLCSGQGVASEWFCTSSEAGRLSCIALDIELCSGPFCCYMHHSICIVVNHTRRCQAVCGHDSIKIKIKS